jgi:hypothetical protein
MKPISNSFQDSEPRESAILKYLEHELPGYDFEAHIDRPFVLELLADFPEIDILEEIKNFRWYYDNAPLYGTSAQRLSIRRWIVRAVGPSSYSHIH